MTVFDLNQEKIISIVTDALSDADGGELFLEHHQSEMLTLENGTLRHSDFNIRQGFGLRSFCEDQTTFFHSSDVNEDTILHASQVVKNNNKGIGKIPLSNKTQHKIYPDLNPINEIEFQEKLSLLKQIYTYIHNTCFHVKKSIIMLSAALQEVRIIQHNGNVVNDIRPLVRLNISVILEKDGKIEQGYCGIGGRNSYKEYFKNWQNLADDAIRQAMVNLEAAPTPAGEMTVILGNGWPGVLLHEAIGHGLEGDFNRKKTSAFSDLIGQRVAAKGIRIVDDGTIQNARGSLNVDDEGNPTQCNTLIEDGILTSYMHDCMNANLMGTKSTGNGRRESYAHLVLPRMTNTYMLPGEYNPEEIIKSTKKGLYAVSFGGGQVDITSGKFVFLASEAYMVENGKITHPVKGATIIGNGPDALTKISMVGNDLKLDPGVGTCSKDGQNIPVGVGQPTLKIDSITVGGTITA